MLPYYPGLRLKQGEIFAASKLPPEFQAHVEPFFVVPPPKEYDHELGHIPTVQEIAYITGERIGKYWPMKRAYLDTQYIAEDLGENGLRTLFRRAQDRNPSIVPVAKIGDLHKPLFRDIQCGNDVKLAITVGYEEIDPVALTEGLKAVGLSAEDCLLFINFTGAPLDPEISVGSISAIFDLCSELGHWKRIVFQGSNFPSKNPAKHGQDVFVQRNEWAVFHAALKESGIPPDQLGYGDFAADCGEMNFPRKNGGARAIRHLRYTTKTHTLVVRAQQEGTDSILMRNVCQRILSSGHFAGQAFSSADDKIFRIANGLDGPGNASMWREWNTSHHITRVVRDLGAMAGIKFSDTPVTTFKQDDLFERENARDRPDVETIDS